MAGKPSSPSYDNVVVISKQEEGKVIRLEQRTYSNGALNPSRCISNNELLDAINKPIDVRDYLIFLEELNKSLGGNPYGRRMGWSNPILVGQTPGKVRLEKVGTEESGYEQVFALYLMEKTPGWKKWKSNVPVPIADIKKGLKQLGYIAVDESEVKGLSGEGLEEVLKKATQEQSQS